MRFEWDAKKAEANMQKHGVSFTDATKAFFDEFGLDEYDENHSNDENRYIRIGLGPRNVLFIIYIIKDEQTETYRLISARKADKEYETAYWKERRHNSG